MSAAKVPAEAPKLHLSDGECNLTLGSGGTSGCLLASRLASAAVSPRHRVLLVEGGGEAEEDPDNLIPGLAVPKFANEAGNWLYQTRPQEHLDGRTIIYPRGKGMGGSSANNYMSWIRGPRCDFDEWAELTGDDWWRWDSSVEYMKRIEDYRPECPEGKEQYYSATKGAHGKRGPIAVGCGKEWQPVVQHCIDACIQAGQPLNLDHNDGDELGISVAQMNVNNGRRTPSTAAFLSPEARSRLTDLAVLTRTLCKRIVFDKDKRAVGIELIPAIPEQSSVVDENPVTVKIEKEVVLAAGTFGSPHILMLSGVGPTEELEKHNIPVLLDSPNIGRNIKDHTALSCEFIIDPSISGHNQLLQDPDRLEQALRQFRLDGSGPLGVFGASAAVVFARLPALYGSPEFKALDDKTQAYLANPNRPSTELWMHGGPMMYQGPKVPADASVLALEGLIQNNLSLGSLHLKSASPRDLPEPDPRYLSQLFDQRIAMETIRLILEIAETPVMRNIIRQPIHGPGPVGPDGRLQSLAHKKDEKALVEFVKRTLTQGFHSMGSCAMGGAHRQDRVVDEKFRVIGLQNVRVADMSVCPILTNNHTQINAYLIGERCAQVMLE